MTFLRVGLGLFTLAVLLIIALILTGCATLTPAQQTGLAETKAFFRAAAKAYDVWEPGVVAGPTTGEGAAYNSHRFLFTISTSALDWRHRDAILAHEFAHYVLDDYRPRTFGPGEWQVEQERKELAANVKAVEILVRVKRISEAEAVGIMRGYLDAAAVAYERGRASWVPGHKHPRAELAEFLAAFPRLGGTAAGFEGGRASD